MKEEWNAHLQSEIKFWQSIIDGSHSNKDWVNNMQLRLSGVDCAANHLHEYLFDSNMTPRVLDVGSGPASCLGNVINGRKIDITAIDPLASEYKKLLQDSNLKSCVEVKYGEAERLQNFVDGKFDFVYSRNALDHSYDPIAAIKSMIDVCNPSSIVYFETIINEGLNANYNGLHQWNFMPASNDLVIWKKDGHGKILGSEIDRNKIESLSSFELYPGWVHVKITLKKC